MREPLESLLSGCGRVANIFVLRENKLCYNTPNLGFRRRLWKGLLVFEVPCRQHRNIDFKDHEEPLE